MVKNGTHTLWKIGLSLLLTLLMLLTGSVGIGEADGPGVQLSTLKIRVLDSTPQRKPKTGVELRIMLGEYVVDQQVSDEDGYIEFPLGSLQTNYYEITGDPGVAEYRIQDCALRLGRTDGGVGYLVSIDNMVPEKLGHLMVYYRRWKDTKDQVITTYAEERSMAILSLPLTPRTAT